MATTTTEDKMNQTLTDLEIKMLVAIRDSEYRSGGQVADVEVWNDTTMDAFAKHSGKRKAAGQKTNDPAAPYQVPGAPKPVEDTGPHNFEWRTGKGRHPETGEIVQGSFKLDKRNGAEIFTPDVTIDSRTGAGGAGRTPAVLQVADAMIAAREAARQADPSLPPLGREEAIQKAQRAPRDRDDIALRERLAAQAAKQDERAWRKDPTATLEKWRQQYGLPPGAVAPGVTTGPRPPPAPAPAPAPGAPQPQPQPAPAPAPAPAPQSALPPRPASVPPNAGYSPGQKKWFARDGRGIWDENGNPVSQ